MTMIGYEVIIFAEICDKIAKKYGVKINDLEAEIYKLEKEMEIEFKKSKCRE